MVIEHDDTPVDGAGSRGEESAEIEALRAQVAQYEAEKDAAQRCIQELQALNGRR